MDKIMTQEELHEQKLIDRVRRNWTDFKASIRGNRPSSEKYCLFFEFVTPKKIKNNSFFIFGDTPDELKTNLAGVVLNNLHQKHEIDVLGLFQKESDEDIKRIKHDEFLTINMLHYREGYRH